MFAGGGRDRRRGDGGRRGRLGPDRRGLQGQGGEHQAVCPFVRPCVTLVLPLWILEFGGLKISGQRLISLRS